MQRDIQKKEPAIKNSLRNLEERRKNRLGVALSEEGFREGDIVPIVGAIGLSIHSLKGQKVLLCRKKMGMEEVLGAGTINQERNGDFNIIVGTHRIGIDVKEIVKIKPSHKMGSMKKVSIKNMQKILLGSLNVTSLKDIGVKAYAKENVLNKNLKGYRGRGLYVKVVDE